MKRICKRLLAIFSLLVSVTVIHAQDLCAPVGWATQNGGTTGGGNVTPTVCSTYAALKTAITSSTVKVIHVSGTINFPAAGRITMQDQTGKTIIGLPGAKLVSTDLTAAGSGILYVKRVTNLIIRNLVFEGPAAYDVDGNDNLTLETCSRVWIDHCEFQDGLDGNLDIKTASDFISVTWCKFVYNKAPIPGGSGGSNDHRFSNLFGSSDGATGDRGKLNITMQYNWWAQGCKARMPRVRFGKVHVVNNYFNSTVAAQCVMAGFEANLLVESNVFENVASPIDRMSNTFTAITSRNNIFTNTTGNTAGSGTAFTPPYSINVNLVSNVKSLVSNPACGAGATMTNPTTCGCSSTPVTFTLSSSATPTAGGTISGAGTYNSGATATVTATPAAGYRFVNWSGDATGSAATTTVNMNSNKAVTANFELIPVTFTLTTTANPTAGGTISGAGTYNSGATATVTATPAAGYRFVNWSGGATGTATTTTVSMNSNKAVTANFELIPLTFTLTTTANPTAGGIISGAGTYNSGATATVTATPAAGYRFVNWSGGATGTATTTTVSMNSNKAVIANFELIPVTFILTTTANPTAGGTVSGAGTYNSGATATVTATPAAGYRFVNWSGDATGTAPTTTVSMNSNKTVTAIFELNSTTNSTIRIEDNATPASGLCVYEGVISSNGGANNGNVINLTNTSSKGITWAINAAAAGAYNFNWRYVNSSTSNTYSMRLLVNGVVINSALGFPRTSGSTVFSNTNTSINLLAGYNSIRLEATTNSATADIDWLEVTGLAPTAASCAAARLVAPVITPEPMKHVATVMPNPAVSKIKIAFQLPAEDRISIRLVSVDGKSYDILPSRRFSNGYQEYWYEVYGKKPGFYTVQITGTNGYRQFLPLMIQ